MSDLKRRRPEAGPEHVDGFRRGNRGCRFCRAVCSRLALSGAVRSCGLPRHWRPKMDADEIVRVREEMEILKELENFGIGGRFAGC